MVRFASALSFMLLGVGFLQAEPNEAAERGKKALESHSFNPAVWSQRAYDEVWKQWGLTSKPADFDKRLRDRFGLHPAPFPNDGLPMGLRKGPTLLGTGVSVDCLVCHGGSILGKSYIGLGNSSLDIQALFQELNKSNGRSDWLPFTFCNVRGTSEAGGMAVFLLGHRTPDLMIKVKRTELGLHDDLCEDPPAWWVLKKKRTMYHTGGADARSVRSIMQFMMGPLNGPSVFDKEESRFRDIQAYVLSLQPPKYPFPIDQSLAAKGKQIFEQTCSKCHGTYGEKWTYPNRIVDIDVIGTDRRRFDGITEEFGRYYNTTWFAKEKPGWLWDDYASLPAAGYQAPPLDGIWATAPYLHNGSVPTVYNLLKSSPRPAWRVPAALRKAAPARRHPECGPPA